MRSFVRALILLHRTYSPLSIGTRVHVLVRFLTCPFLRIVRAIPPDARTMLEIGSGHALFSRLAIASDISRSVAVEPDARKVMALRPIEGIARVVGFDHCVRGRFDAVAMIDVLYLVPVAEWDSLLGRCRDRLAPGGMLLVKEIDPDGGLKSAWNRLQETISVRILGITLGREMHFESRAAFTARLERLGFTAVKAERIDAWYPHPHVLYTAIWSAVPAGTAL